MLKRFTSSFVTHEIHSLSMTINVHKVSCNHAQYVCMFYTPLELGFDSTSYKMLMLESVKFDLKTALTSMYGENPVKLTRFRLDCVSRQGIIPDEYVPILNLEHYASSPLSHCDEMLQLNVNIIHQSLPLHPFIHSLPSIRLQHISGLHTDMGETHVCIGLNDDVPLAIGTVAIRK